MRTTINISDALLEELRTEASARKRPFRHIVEETLQRGLAASRISKKKVRIKSYPVGIKAPYLGMSLNQLYDQVESDEILKVAEE